MSKAKAKAPRVFVPLTKVDEEQRLVYGRITAEEQDKTGEVMDYTKSKPNFEKWSNDIHTASGGLSKGNVRVMHGLTVAGKLTELEFDDDSMAIEVCSKVVDDAEWNKVLEGCYTGFSVGGKYGKRWKETVDGVVLNKYEAIPNEVSLVDNPCVTSATFSLVKADGAEEQVMFKVAAEEKSEEEKTEEESEKKDESKEKKKESVKKVYEPANTEVASKAGELAKAANDGTTWMDHVDAAREELIKNHEAGDEDGGDTTAVEGTQDADPAAKEEPAEDTGEEVTKVTPAGVKQVWEASDGKTFGKKDECIAHEETLGKAEPTEAEKLAARLEKALLPVSEDDPVDIFSLDRIDDLHKAVLELEGPRDLETAEPLLEKGMYTVSRFANMLGDVASLARTIKAEGVLEVDGEDTNVSKTLQDQLGSFGESFMTYAKQQVAELVSGLDADMSPRACYDYYYRAAGEGNDLAKNVVEMITSVEPEMEEAQEGLEKLAKSFGFVSGTLESTTDELSPPLKKRFEELEKDRDEFKKIAEDAVGKIEELNKRVDAVEDQPLPRAPGTFTAFREGDQSFFGKRAETQDEKMGILREMLETHGADGLATMMIKAAHATGGQKLQLKQ